MEALKVDWVALKGDEKALNAVGKPLMGEGGAVKCARKAFTVNREALKGLGDVLKGDGKAKRY